MAGELSKGQSSDGLMTLTSTSRKSFTVNLLHSFWLLLRYCFTAVSRHLWRHDEAGKDGGDQSAECDIKQI